MSDLYKYQKKYNLKKGYANQRAWNKENDVVFSVKYSGSKIKILDQLKVIAACENIPLSGLFKRETEKLLADPKYKEVLKEYEEKKAAAADTDPADTGGGDA